jgi:hypothetical protein
MMHHRNRKKCYCSNKKKGKKKKQKSKCPENLALNKKSIKILLIFMPKSYLFAGNRGKRRVRKIIMQK